MKVFSILFALSLLALGCSHQKLVSGRQDTVTKAGVVSVWTDWVKPKGKSYDLRFHIKSESEDPILVLFSDVQCLRGDVIGEMRYTFYNTGERFIDIHPGQDKNANMVCKFPAPVKGPFKVTIKRVYANPNGDGKTTGKVLAKDIEWKMSDRAPADGSTED